MIFQTAFLLKSTLISIEYLSTLNEAMTKQQKNYLFQFSERSTGFCYSL